MADTILGLLYRYATGCFHAAPLLIYMTRFAAKDKVCGMVLNHLFLEEADLCSVKKMGEKRNFNAQSIAVSMKRTNFAA